MYVTLEHSRHRINPGFHSQSSQSKILKKIPDFLQNAAKQIVPWERSFHLNGLRLLSQDVKFNLSGMSAAKGDFILQIKEDILLPRKSVFFEEFYLT